MMRGILAVIEMPISSINKILEIMKEKAPRQKDSLPVSETSVKIIDSISKLVDRLCQQEKNVLAIMHLQAHIRTFLMRRRYFKIRKLFKVYPQLVDRNKAFTSLVKKEKQYKENLDNILKVENFFIHSKTTPPFCSKEKKLSSTCSLLKERKSRGREAQSPSSSPLPYSTT